MICFPDSIRTYYHFAGNYTSNYPLIEVCTCYTKLTSKACVEQCLEAYVYAHDKAHIY